MPRAYVDVSKFRTPFNYPNLTLTGLGADPLRTEWPAGRSYIDTSRYRSPYIDYQFQDNTLFGLGADRVARPRGQKVTAAAPPPPHMVSLQRRRELAGIGSPRRPTRPRGPKPQVVTALPPADWTSMKRPMAGAPTGPLPEGLEAYVRTGAPMSSIKRDLGAAMAQVPRVVWGLGAVVAGYVAYKAWKAA
jgi:hypothetical protein